jgi:hypothetical protein
MLGPDTACHSCELDEPPDFGPRRREGLLLQLGIASWRAVVVATLGADGAKIFRRLSANKMLDRRLCWRVQG